MIMMVMMNRMIDIILIFIEIRLSGERTFYVVICSRYLKSFAI